MQAALGVVVFQFRHDLDRVQPRVLRQCVRNHLHRLGEGLDAVLLHAGQRLGPLAQLAAELDLGRAATRDEERPLHQAPDHAQRVVEGAVRLFEHQLVGAAHYHGRGAAHVGDAGHLHDPAHADANLLHKIRDTQLLGLHVVDVRDGQQVERFGDELDLVALNVAHHEDLGLGEVVQGQLGGGVTKDGLLNEQHVAARRFDLLHHAEDIVALFLQETIHRCVVREDDIVLEVRLGRRHAELDERDLGALHLGGPARRLGRLLVEYEPLHELGRVHGVAQLLNNPHIPQVHHLPANAGTSLCNTVPVRPLDLSSELSAIFRNAQDAVHGDGRQQGRVLRHDLAAEGGSCTLDQCFAVVQINWDGQ
mmetsp:Transcript_460/g.818  ORF Transcript_460/g.818 Transcript_460/m.818 type:complete len:364 (+) Transcript_460:355-1446(+)